MQTFLVVPPRPCRVSGHGWLQAVSAGPGGRGYDELAKVNADGQQARNRRNCSDSPITNPERRATALRGCGPCDGENATGSPCQHLGTLQAYLGSTYVNDFKNSAVLSASTPGRGTIQAHPEDVAN